MRLRLRRREKERAEIPPAVESQVKTPCPKCSKILPSGAIACPYCREILKEVESAEQEAPRSLKRSALLLLRDIGLAALIVLIVLGAIFAYTRVWPPMVVVESNSMQHRDDVSYIGVIDTGDLVLVQTAPQRSDVITWVEGKATGYKTYSNYGDVIIFKQLDRDTPIIHRPIFWMNYNPVTLKFDIPALENPALAGLWGGTYANGTPVGTPRNLDGDIWIKESGWKGDLTITFRIGSDLIKTPSSPYFQYSGYVTMGDNNAYKSGRGYDTYLVRQGDIFGKARGELPWFGLIKLTLAPTRGACCSGWGDPSAPRNSWDSLTISLVLIIVTPIIIDISLALLHRWKLKRREAKAAEVMSNPSAAEHHLIPRMSKEVLASIHAGSPTGSGSEERPPEKGESSV